MTIKRIIIKLTVVVAVIMFLSSCYYYDFNPLTGTWHVRYTFWDAPDKYYYNTINFNTDGTFSTGEDDWLFGNKMFTRTWSQDGDQLSLKSVYNSEFFSQTVDFTATLTDSGGDEATAGSGTYNFNYANDHTDTGSSEWWLSKVKF